MKNFGRLQSGDKLYFQGHQVGEVTLRDDTHTILSLFAAGGKDVCVTLTNSFLWNNRISLSIPRKVTNAHPDLPHTVFLNQHNRSHR